ncbi:MAG TPA: hypothetical protein VI248_06105 [Kineosporiaceae bacterium]
MPTLDPTSLHPADLAPMLRAWASGSHPSEAASGLLIAHGHWLHRRDFLARLVDAVDGGWGPRGTVVPLAAIDWHGVAAFAADARASSSELAVLRLAASLAGSTLDVSLMELTAGLDDTNARHLLDALAHRLGWHQRGTQHLVTGHQADDPPHRATPWTEPLPTFEELRGHAYRLLVDAANALRSDHQPGTGPSGPAADAVRQAFASIGAAKNALDDAAYAHARSHARHRAEADSAQYPDQPHPETRHG